MAGLYSSGETGMIVNGTGHRPFQQDKKTKLWVSKLEFPGAPGNSRQLYDRLTDLAYAWLSRHPEVDTVISGCAMGWDLALARGALKAGKKLHMYVPYNGHGQTWKTFYKQEHNELLTLADYIYAPDVPFSVGALLKRNEDMVNAADMCLALWDGTPGGTGSCVKYAEKVGKPVVNLWDYWNKHKEKK